MENVKQKAREMFDELESFDSFFASLPADEEPLCKEIYYIRVIQPFIDQIIDLAIAERDRNIVEMIEKERKYHREFECSGAHNGRGCYEDWCEDQNCRNAPKEFNSAIDLIINLINSKK